MRTVTLTNGQEKEVNPLTRGQVRKLKPIGFGTAMFSVPREDYDEASDTVLALQFPDFEDLPEPDCRALFAAILAETYGSREEEKNSLPSGQSDQTANE
jgi:hypothetical protein